MADSISRNNLWISVTGGNIWNLSGSVPETTGWATDWDYDGFDWGGAGSPFQMNGATYATLAGLAAGTGQEMHGLKINHAACLPGMNVPADAPASTPPQ